MMRLAPLFALAVGLAPAAALDFVQFLGDVQPAAVAIGADGSAYIVGTDLGKGRLPVTPGAYRAWEPLDCQWQVPRGAGAIGGAPIIIRFNCPDGFLVRLDSEGRLVFATYLSGSHTSGAIDVAVGPNGHAYVSGRYGANFFTPPGSVPTGGGDVMKLAPDGSALNWSSTEAGGGPIAVTPDGGVLSAVSGTVSTDCRNGCVTVRTNARFVKLAAADGTVDRIYELDRPVGITAFEIAVDGSIWFTTSDRRLERLSADGREVLFSAPLAAAARSLALGPSDSVVLAGLNAAEPPRVFLTRISTDSFDGGSTRVLETSSLADVFLDPQMRPTLAGQRSYRFDSDGREDRSAALLGGAVYAAARDVEGRLWLVGATEGNTPVQVEGDSRSWRSEAPAGFVTALDFDRESGHPKITGVENGASFLEGPIAPGEILTLRGRWFAFDPAIYTLGQDGRIANELRRVRVEIGGRPATPLYLSPHQINIIAPYGLAPGSEIEIQVFTDRGASTPVVRRVANATPGLFTQDGSGSGTVMALDADLREIGDGNPAAPGQAIALFATGIGALVPAPPTNRLIPPMLPTPAPVLDVKVEIGGILVEPEWIGASPTRPAGIVQVNVRVPEEITPGLGVPIRLLAGDGVESQRGVTIPVVN